MVAEVVGATVGDDEPLMAAGLDSLAVVELQGRVAAAFAAPLSATVVLDYPTLSVIPAPKGLAQQRPCPSSVSIVQMACTVDIGECCNPSLHLCDCSGLINDRLVSVSGMVRRNL